MCMAAGALPLFARWKRERRGALWVLLETRGPPVHLVNTHLGPNLRDRLVEQVTDVRRA
jgi:endonuclease/exonuclease/phosphatase family metal-dependent hydrolase